MEPPTFVWTDRMAQGHFKYYDKKHKKMRGRLPSTYFALIGSTNNKNGLPLGGGLRLPELMHLARERIGA